MPRSSRIDQVDYAGFVSLSAGYDSNFNTGARDDTIVIPLFGGFQVRLSRLFVEQHSAFVGPALGGSVTKTLSRTTQVFAAASANGRYHFSGNDFIPYTLSALAGVQYATGPDALRLSIDTRQHLVTHFHLQRFFGATAQYRRLLSRHDEFELFLRASLQEFPETRRLDSNLYLGGGSWTHVFGGDDGPRVTFSAFVGTNDERGNDPTVGREMFGAQLAVRYAVTERDFEGQADGDESALFSLLRGGLRAITGLIGGVNKERYRLRTPLATIGIRGTTFSARLCAADCTVPDGLYVKGGEGIVFVQNVAGSIDVGRGRPPSSPAPTPYRNRQRAIRKCWRPRVPRKVLPRRRTRRLAMPAPMSSISRKRHSGKIWTCSMRPSISGSSCCCKQAATSRASSIPEAAALHSPHRRPPHHSGPTGAGPPRTPGRC